MSLKPNFHILDTSYKRFLELLYKLHKDNMTKNALS
jgi:hypothetical protein